MNWLKYFAAVLAANKYVARSGYEAELATSIASSRLLMGCTRRTGSGIFVVNRLESLGSVNDVPGEALGDDYRS